MTFGEKLRRLHEASGMSGTELAGRLGISTAAFYYLERGERVPYFPTLQKLAKAFGCSLSELLRGVE